MFMKSKFSLSTAAAALLVFSLAACGVDDSVNPLDDGSNNALLAS